MPALPIKRPPAFGRVPIVDKRDSELLSAEAEARGENKSDLGEGRAPDALLHRYNALHLSQIAKFDDLLQLPGENEVQFFFSQKSLNAYTLILWLLRELGRVDELFVTTFNLNQDIIRAFAGLIDSDSVGRLSIVLSQSIESRMPERVEELRQLWDARQDRMRVSLCWNHSKVALADAGPGKKFVITGSGNYSFNAEIEQYEAWNSAALHEFCTRTLERRCFSEARMNARHKIWGVDRGIDG